MVSHLDLSGPRPGRRLYILARQGRDALHH